MQPHPLCQGVAVFFVGFVLHKLHQYLNAVLTAYRNSLPTFAALPKSNKKSREQPQAAPAKSNLFI
jgi:hypothetical protein